MKFKLKRLDRGKHTDIVSCVSWSNSGELFRYCINIFKINSVSDDMTIWKWDMNGEPVSINFSDVISLLIGI